jgi:hypothetical protein
MNGILLKFKNFGLLELLVVLAAGNNELTSIYR